MKIQSIILQSDTTKKAYTSMGIRFFKVKWIVLSKYERLTQLYIFTFSKLAPLAKSLSIFFSTAGSGIKCGA